MPTSRVTDGAVADEPQTASGPASPAADDQAELGENEQGARERTPEELEEIHRANAFTRALDAVLTDIRQRSYEGKLTTPARWRKRAFAPAGMEPAAFEEAVLTYIEGHDHGAGESHTGRIAAPKPLEVELEGVEVDPDEPLPERPVSDIVLRYGKKGIYLYSEALLANNYAQILFLNAEDNDLTTFVTLVRDESKTYPRPMDETSFMNPPFLWSRKKVRELFDRACESGSFPDIKRTVTTRNQRFYYSDLYLRDAQAKSLAQFYGVERGMNP